MKEGGFAAGIAREIRRAGPMGVDAFMARANAHYYGKGDPFGAGGDFVTAPEISQMFGEMIGAWAADAWVRMGRPAPFLLAECGPGRGTLMADLLRAVRSVPGFTAAARIHLVEISRALQARQAEALAGHEVRWCGSVADLPDGMPLILLANEFLDALPVRQFTVQGGRWRERMVTVGVDGTLVFGVREADADAAADGAAEGAIRERSPARDEAGGLIARRVAGHGGAALFIDYGYERGAGDTLQAVKDHAYADILVQAGDADLTAHVDFGALAQVGAAAGAAVHGPAGQGDFLLRLGIMHRAAALLRAGAERTVIEAALHRLSAPEQMGALFKVMAFSGGGLVPEGFGDVSCA